MEGGNPSRYRYAKNHQNRQQGGFGDRSLSISFFHSFSAFQ
jgi:hypothetical protein